MIALSLHNRLAGKLALVRIALILVLALNHAANAADQTIPTQQHSYAGGLVSFHIDKLSEQIPVVNFGLQQAAIVDAGDQWRVLLGLDLRTVPGNYVVFVHHSDTSMPATSLEFPVRPNNYPLIDQSDIPAAWSQLRLTSLSEIDFANSDAPALPLRYPASGDWRDFFGYIPVQRDDDSLGTQLDHRALLIERISVVTAPQNGLISRIVQPSDAALGYRVVIDHGRDVFSILSGLTDINVEVGDGIIAGAVIGRVAVDTQRRVSNKPSWLLWQTVLNQAYVDPLLLTGALSGQ